MLYNLIKSYLKKQNIEVNAVDFERQRTFLMNFPNPIDDIERSYNQYQCQNFLRKRKKTYTIIINFCCFFVLLYIIILNIFLKLYRWIMPPKNKSNISYQRILAYNGNNASIPAFVPVSLRENIFCFNIYNVTSLNNKKDWKYIYNIYKRYPFSFFFVLKVILKISAYSVAINKYNPQQIICSCEYSFTSSILTNYCERAGVQHVNIMHGEKLFFIRDAFCRFSISYVWDEYYISLFNALRHYKKQPYRVEIPSLFFPKYINVATKVENKYDYTYYLQSESEEELLKILIILKRMQEKGCRIKLRPHPRYTNMKILDSYNATISSIDIEDSSQVPLYSSFTSTKNVIAKFSTVLNQALYLSIPIIIDDITDVSLYQYLKESRYFVLQKPHRILSNVLEQIECLEYKN